MLGNFKKCFIFLLVFLSLVNPSHAQSPENTISVVPQLTRLDLSIDKPEAEIIYSNNTNETIELSLTVENVKELENRNPVGLLDPAESANYKYSLASWVYLDRQNVIIKPHEKQKIKVSIDDNELSPGGHYGAILAEFKQNEDNREIKLRGILTSLLFVRASTGNEIEKAKVNSFDPARSGLEFPKEFVIRFQNNGNVDLTPYGLIEIKDFNGKLVAKGILNEGSLITLPEAVRRYDVPITFLEKIILPGKYTATLNLHYGKGRQEIKLETQFTTQGSTSTGTLLTVAGIIALLLITNRVIKRKKKKQK